MAMTCANCKDAEISVDSAADLLYQELLCEDCYDEWHLENFPSKHWH